MSSVDDIAAMAGEQWPSRRLMRFEGFDGGLFTFALCRSWRALLGTGNRCGSKNADLEKAA